jgi:multidrug resistance efflux pump
LNDQCDETTGARCGLVVFGPNGGKAQAAAVWPPGSRPSIEVYAAARDTFLGKLAIQRVAASTENSAKIYAFPLRAGDRPVGAVAIEVDNPASASDDAVLARLRQSATRLFPLLAPAQPPVPGPVDVLRLQATLLSHRRLSEAATALANELASMLRCSRVSVGLVESRRARVIAVSHSAGTAPRGRAFGPVAAAMDEAIDQGAAVTYPTPEQGKPRITLAHAELNKSSGNVTLTLPLVAERRPVGALTLEFGPDGSFIQDEVETLENLASLVGPLLLLKRDAERSWWQRLRHSLRTSLAHLFGPGHPLVKAAVASTVTAAMLLTLIPIAYRVGAPARLEGQIQRSIVAPADGFLQQVYVRPGDSVKAGQKLVELAQQDLQLERQKWQSTLAQHENAYGAALAKGDRSQLAISLARMQEAQAQLDLVEQQLVRARLDAPFDGVVIKGDLTQSLGAPVQKGDVLLTVAPAGQFRLIVEVDEQDIADLQVGQQGRLALAALPDDIMALTVERITPVASTAEERNFFEVEARLANAPGLRPGLRGVAKIDAGVRPLAWVWLHRAAAWLRMTLWTWGA